MRFHHHHHCVDAVEPTSWERLRRQVGVPALCDGADLGGVLGSQYFQDKWKEFVRYFVRLPCLTEVSFTFAPK